MSTVEKKKKVVSYVESSADQSSAVIQDITQVTDLYQPFNVGRDGIYLDQVRSPIGERSFPGQSLGEIEAADLTQQGFLWGDTPEASVFIRKKQWREEGWNLGVPKGKSEDVDYKENRDFDLQVREIAGRIITRKLEWLNDHEQFTKSSAALRTFLVNNKELPQFIRGKYEVTETNGEKLKSVMNKILELLYGQTAAEKLPKDQKGAFVKKFFADNENIIWNAVVVSKTANGQILSVDEYNKQHEDLTLLVPKGTILFYDSIPSDTINQFLTRDDTSGYISPKGDLTASAKELLLNLYAPTPLSDGAFTRYFQTLVKLNTPGADQPQLKTVFNGMIEFANISSISVSRALNGDGTANLTFENPGNIMMFSRTDMELGLSEFTGEDPYAGMAGSGKGEGDKELSNVSNLVFYRGRYYTKTAKENLGYSYADITAGGPQVGVAPEFSKIFQGVKSVTSQKYTVSNDGETVESISKKTHYSIAEILELNPHLQARFNEQQAAKLQKKSLEELQREEASQGLPPKTVVAVISGVTVRLIEDAMKRVLAADEAFFKATGKHIQINSSYRDGASESRFSDKYPMSGPSYHQRGMALDVQNWEEAGPYLRAQGFKNPLQGTAGNSKTWDPVHFSLGFKGWEQDVQTGKVGDVSGSEST